MSSKKIIIVVLLLIALLACLIGIGLAIYFFNSKIPVHDYAVKFDAGASGTKMHVYEWNSEFSPNKTHDLEISEIGSCETDDKGIDKIKDREDLRRKFEKCIKKAHELVPDSRKNRTKISLGATGGIRLLGVNSGAVSNSVLNLIREHFSSSGFLFERESQVKSIDGRDEALSAWIAANYLENNFVKLHPENNTRGVLELGGSSSQIVFVPQNLDPRRSKEVELFGKTYRTYSQSFLCYGLNEAHLMYFAQTVKNNNFNQQTRASCNPVGTSVTLSKLDLNRSPCANGNMYNEQLPYAALQRDYLLSGDSNFRQCVQDVKQIFNKNHACTSGNDACSFRNVFIANIKNSKFLAVSAFWHALNETNRLFNQSLQHNMDGFKHATGAICGMSINELLRYNESSRAGLDRDRLTKFCFQNTYIIELLSQYGFENLDNIKIVDKINGQNLDWTMGNLIEEVNHGNYLPYESRPRKLPLLYFTIVLIALSLLAILFLILFIWALGKNWDE